MSILIKDMMMPKSCWECRFNASTIDHREACLLTKKTYNWGLTTPPGDCPLIEIPPHGDLIDRDALVRDNGIKEIPEYYEVVRDAPTIIPAEPCNDLAKPNDTIFAVQNTDEDERLFEAKPIDYMHTPSVEEIIEADGLDSFIKHFED